MMHMAITISVIISLLEVVHRKMSGVRSLFLKIGHAILVAYPLRSASAR